MGNNFYNNKGYKNNTVKKANYLEELAAKIKKNSFGEKEQNDLDRYVKENLESIKEQLAKYNMLDFEVILPYLVELTIYQNNSELKEALEKKYSKITEEKKYELNSYSFMRHVIFALSEERLADPKGKDKTFSEYRKYIKNLNNNPKNKSEFSELKKFTDIYLNNELDVETARAFVEYYRDNETLACEYIEFGLNNLEFENMLELYYEVIAYLESEELHGAVYKRFYRMLYLNDFLDYEKTLRLIRLLGSSTLTWGFDSDSLHCPWMR